MSRSIPKWEKPMRDGRQSLVHCPGTALTIDDTKDRRTNDSLPPGREQLRRFRLSVSQRDAITRITPIGSSEVFQQLDSSAVLLQRILAVIRSERLTEIHVAFRERTTIHAAVRALLQQREPGCNSFSVVLNGKLRLRTS